MMDDTAGAKRGWIFSKDHLRLGTGTTALAGGVSVVDLGFTPTSWRCCFCVLHQDAAGYFYQWRKVFAVAAIP